MHAHAPDGDDCAPTPPDPGRLRHRSRAGRRSGPAGRYEPHDEPEAYVADTWDLVGGTLEVTIADNRLAIGTFTDVVAVDPDGDEHQLGDVEVANGMWGFLAG